MTTQAKVPVADSAPAVAPVRDVAVSPPRSRKFTVDEYYRMAEVGILKC